jgi:hypothetical protein
VGFTVACFANSSSICAGASLPKNRKVHKKPRFSYNLLNEFMFYGVGYRGFDDIQVRKPCNPGLAGLRACGLAGLQPQHSTAGLEAQNTHSGS